MELTGRDFERIPRTNLRIPVGEFARLWLVAERHGDAQAAAGRGDPYLAGVQMTCRWLAGAFVTVDSPSGPTRDRASAPITWSNRKAYEELIAEETVAAECKVASGGFPGRPGLAEGVLATLLWAWRRSGVPPIDIEQAQVS